MGNCLPIEGDGGGGGGGGGGPTAEERRRLQMAAADRRAQDGKGRGLTSDGAARLQKGQKQQANAQQPAAMAGGDGGGGLKWSTGN